jgi:hypothetical protein
MNREERQLLERYRSLGEAQKQSLLDFADFLGARARMTAEPVPQQPLHIPRPENETVIKAIRRLTMTYPMLDRNKLFHDTAHYMTQHTVQGRPAAEVIDELEIVFKRHYEAYLEGPDSTEADR